jgi:hypothetical protein
MPVLPTNPHRFDVIGVVRVRDVVLSRGDTVSPTWLNIVPPRHAPASRRRLGGFRPKFPWRGDVLGV